MKQSASGRSADSAGPVGEEDEHNRRRQREARPRSESTAITGPQETDGKSNLAGGRAGQKLAERHEIDISLFVESAPAYDKFFAEIPDVSDWPAKAAYTQLEENQQDFKRRAFPLAPHRNIFYGASHRVVSFAAGV